MLKQFAFDGTQIVYFSMERPALGLIETRDLSGAMAAARAATREAQVVIVSVECTERDHMTVKIEGEWGSVQSALEAGARAVEKSGALLAVHIIPRADDSVKKLLPYEHFVAKYLSGDHAPKKATRKPRPRRHTKPSASEESKASAVRPQVKIEPDAPVAPKTPSSVEPLLIESAKERHSIMTGALTEPQVETSFEDPGQALSISDMEKMPMTKLRKHARSIKNLPIQGRQISMANKQQLLDAIRLTLGDQLD